jgi:predicted permease
LYLESLTLSLAGGAVAIVLSNAVLKSVLAISTARLPRVDQISVDTAAMLFTLTLSIVAGIAFGTLPVLRHGGTGLAQTLRAGGRTASASRGRNFARNTLTVVQVALALVLLIGSGLMIRTFQSMRRVHPGFHNPEALQTLRISIPSSATLKDTDIALLHQNLVSRLSAIPGVSTASLIGGLPMTGASSQDPIFARDHSYADNQIPPLRRFITTAPGTFQALGASLVAGREYTWTDIHEKRRVVIIGENFAREYWGSASAAIGKQIKSNPNDPWSEVVGVVADIRHDGPNKKAPSSVYWPMRAPSSARYLVRGPRAGTESLSTEIRQAIAAVNPNLPVTDVQTMLEIYRKAMSRTAFTLTLLAISGGMALLLAAVGIYALISYTVAQRRREIGIRMALGAQQAKLKLMFLRNGLLLSSLGAAAGLTAAAALSRLMATLLFEVSPLDPLTYAAVAACLLAAAAIASYLPARRIMQVDPIEALRAE